MMSTNDSGHDFLNEVSSVNFGKAKGMFQFKFNHYTTLFVVDTYDVIEFCFPGVFHSNDRGNIQFNVSTFLSYEFFFLHYPQKHILLKEHKRELFHFWRSVQDKIEVYASYKNLKERMIEEYKSLETEAGKIGFLESNIAILLAISFGALSKTASDRFHKLVTSSLQINSISVSEENNSDLIESIFLDTKPNARRVEEAFVFFLEHKKFNISRIKSEDYDFYLEGVLRDIRAYDRIVSINRQLVEAADAGKLSKRYNVLLLSSVTRKFEIIEEFYRDYLPTYEGIKSDSLHRNILEFYLFQLLNVEETDIKKSEIIEILETFEKVTTIYTSNVKRIDLYKAIFEARKDTFNISMLQSVKGIDDIFLKYHSMNIFREKINEAIKVLKLTKDDTKLLDEFTSLLDKAKDGANSLKELNDSLHTYNLLIETKSEIIGNINYLRDNKYNLKVQLRKGKDSVKSTFQTFPVLLFYKKRSIKVVQQIFREIINPEEHNEKLILKLIDFPGHILHEFTAFERKVFFLFIRYLYDDSFLIEDLLDELEVYRQLNNNSLLQTEYLEGYNLQIHFKRNEDLYNEIIYFKTWVLRWDNQYEEAIDIINEIDKQPYGTMDVRLYHSRALCYKSWYYRLSSLEGTDELIGYLEKALSDFHICEDGYEKLIKQGISEVLMSDIECAVSNSIIDTYTKLFILSADKYGSFIPSCRQRLNNLKKTTKNSGYNWDSLLAFGHTEIDLEYCESELASQEDNINLAKAKIMEAGKRLEEIKQSPEFESYSAFRDSEDRIRKKAKFLLQRK